MGIETKIMPKEYTVPALVQAILDAIGSTDGNAGVGSVSGKTREAGRGN
jgi:hypothetical protein